ncbi:MAG: helix-turn-helix domain-containing protein [Lachnospiraceae bacterium]|nr:helix-turn-helix domain-containing protein [Lachnospiraceae bacterium]
MAILKNRTQTNFTMISNNIFHDKELSMKDRGVLCTLFSLPDGWEFSVAGLSSIVPDGVDSISKSIIRLEELGYIERTKTRDENGKFTTYIEVFIEKKTVGDLPSREIRDGKSVTDNPQRENRDGFPVTGNPVQYNKNNQKKEIKETNAKSISQSETAPTDRQTEEYKKLIADNIKLNWLLEVAEQHSDESETQMVNNIYDTICDMVCYPRDNITIKGVSYPWEVIKARFLKLSYDDIAALLNRLPDASLNIKDMSKYLISSLYTQSMVGTLESESRITDEYLKHIRGNPY